MKSAPGWYIAIATLTVALLLPGCNKKPKKAKAKEAEQPAPVARNEAPGGGLLPPGLNPGIAKNLPAVGRAGPMNDLNQFAILYQATMPPPRSLADMSDLARDARRLHQAIQQGIYVVNWGLRPGSDNSQTILAYVRDAPTRGGLVVLLDGSVHNYSVEEFKASPKAGAATPKRK